MWNPSFDVTPACLITGVITEVGVAMAAGSGGGGIIDIAAFLRAADTVASTTASSTVTSTVTSTSASSTFATMLAVAVTPVDAPTGYRIFKERDIAEYVSHLGVVADVLGLNTTTTSDCIDAADISSKLTVEEVGDGNINFVYIVTSSINGGKVVVKQALPYVRCVGESWPMTIERAYFEATALKEEKSMAPKFVPRVFHFDKTNALIGNNHKASISPHPSFFHLF